MGKGVDRHEQHQTDERGKGPRSPYEEQDAVNEQRDKRDVEHVAPVVNQKIHIPAPKRTLEPFHFETALATHRYGPPQRGVDSAQNDIFWQNANVDFCKKSTFICSRGRARTSERRRHGLHKAQGLRAPRDVVDAVVGDAATCEERHGQPRGFRALGQFQPEQFPEQGLA